MSRINKKATDYRVDTTARLAGGYGTLAAKQSAEGQLRRLVMTCLLWEDNAYISGADIVKQISALVPQVDPPIVAKMATDARHIQKLRHVPLLLVAEMCKHSEHRKLVSDTLYSIIQRVDEMAEFLSIYWRNGRTPIANQVKKGLARCFGKFNEYQFGKYKGTGKQIKLKDVMALVHPKPASSEQQALFKKIWDGTLATPDTWEVALSAGKDKKATWERLIAENKLGALAFLRNLRNMNEAKVDEEVVRYGFENVNARWLLPINYYAAAKASPGYKPLINNLMLRGFAQLPKIPGRTIFVVDVSGSMRSGISSNSQFSRMEVASIMSVIARERFEDVVIYATAGNDGTRTHQTALVKDSYHGFAMSDNIVNSQHSLGGGGIFTRQCLEYIRKQESVDPERIIIFSDSQDCDYPDRRVPKPFGKFNYICDVSTHSRGVNYEGVWTAEISGWSEHFIDYILGLEGYTLQSEEEE